MCMTSQLLNSRCFLTSCNSEPPVFSQEMTEAANRMCAMLGNSPSHDVGKLNKCYNNVITMLLHL